MNKVFLDTDVLLDIFLEREPHHTTALRLLTVLRQKGTACYTSPLVLANMNYLLSKAKGRDYALGRLRSLRRMVDVAPIGQTTVDNALSTPHRDLEDSLQMYCALENGIQTLVTRNVKDYPKGKVLIVDPNQYLSTKALEGKG
jgi:predicted nucleic acid-binding protein